MLLPTPHSVALTALGSLACFVVYSGYMAWLIRDGAVPLVFLYPQSVQDVAVEGGLITREQIASNRTRFL